MRNENRGSSKSETTTNNELNPDLILAGESIRLVSVTRKRQLRSSCNLADLTEIISGRDHKAAKFPIKSNFKL